MNGDEGPTDYFLVKMKKTTCKTLKRGKETSIRIVYQKKQLNSRQEGKMLDSRFFTPFIRGIMPPWLARKHKGCDVFPAPAALTSAATFAD
jgi:hypothetical protein